MVFIDDRPCNRRRPCSFNDALLERSDVLPILIRFPETFARFSPEYIERTEHLPSFMTDPSRTAQWEAARFASWCDAKGLRPDSFCCMSEPQQIFGQAFARALGLPALPEGVTRSLRDKRAMKRRLCAAGLRTAKFSSVRDVEDLLDFGEVHGYPVVLKPIDGWGTLDTVLVRTPAEAQTHRTRIERRGTMMAETFIPHEEVECCALLFEGRVLDTFVSRMPGAPLDVARHGALNANISVGPAKAAYGLDFDALTQRVVDAFGLRHGYLHMELFVGPGGSEAVIGELALRYPGCEIAKNHGLAHGFDIADATVDLYLGREPTLRYTDDRCVGDLLLPYAPGRVEHFTSAAQLSRLPGVLEVHLGIERGEVLPPQPASSFACSGWVFVEGTSPAQVEHRMREVLRRYQLHTVPPTRAHRLAHSAA